MIKKIFIIFIILLGIIIITGGIGLWYFDNQISHPASNQPQDITFVVENGKGVKEIAWDLQEKGLIGSPFIFETYVWLEGVGSALKAGEYQLNTGMNIKEIVKTIFKGEALSEEVTIQVIEGWNSKEIANHVAEKIYAESDSGYAYATEKEFKEKFLEAVNTADSREIIPGKTYDFLTDKATDEGLEGYLFPDTYRIFRDSTPAQIIEKMLDNFEKKFTSEMSKDIKDQGKTVFEVMTMASILEKEVRTKNEKKKAADIFYRRIAAGIPLQADATITYILDKKTTELTNADLETDSPYNTYKYKGLPPGPISHPGLESIMAAIYPEANDYWYYLTKPEDGEAVFSKTLEEHNRNKIRYLK